MGSVITTFRKPTASRRKGLHSGRVKPERQAVGVHGQSHWEPIQDLSVEDLDQISCSEEVRNPPWWFSQQRMDALR